MKIPVIFVQDREFIEKKVVFRRGNAVYIYGTSVKESLYPVASDITRGVSLMTCSRISKMNDMLIYETATQMDFKLNAPMFILGRGIAKKMEQFRRELIAKLEEKL